MNTENTKEKTPTYHKLIYYDPQFLTDVIYPNSTISNMVATEIENFHAI